MNNTRRLFALLLSLLMLFSLLVSCGGEDTPDTPANDNPSDGQTPSDKPDDTGKEDEPEEDTPRFTPIALKNNADLANVTQRLFYPDTVSLLRGLETVRKNIDGALSDPVALRSYLSRLYADAQGLGIYVDYAGHTSLANGDVIYGAAEDDYAIGGGKGYPLADKNYNATVTSDDSLKTALQYAEKGDVILIADDICIDMSDWMLGGEVEGFTIDSGKIKYEMVIPEGVTLMGKRGDGNKAGAIIKVSSYTNIAMRLEKDARLSGLVIQGPDTPDNQNVPAANHSIGILIEGDGARIDNCEISGFSRQAIIVKDAKDVKLDHNFIHHLQGESGVAVYANNASVSLEYNLFSQVNTVASVFGNETELTVQNNVVVSDVDKALFSLSSSPQYDADYEKARLSCKSIVIKNNTFLCPGDLFAVAGIPATAVIENNIFAYGEGLYLDHFAEYREVDASIYDAARMSIKHNVYNILAPKVMSKTSKGLVDDGVTLTAFVPESKEAVKTDVKTENISVLSANYYPNESDFPYVILKTVIDLTDNAITDGMKMHMNEIMSYIGGYANYLEYIDTISQEIDGETYGAKADEKGNIGGGVGYYRIFTEKDATVVVRTKGELISAIKSAKDGDVIYVHEDARIDLSDAQSSKMDNVIIGAKITLCSNRGYVYEDGSVSTGGVITSTALTSKTLFNVTADGVRISGLNFYGPDPATHESHHRHAFSMGYFPPCNHHAPDDLDHAYAYNLQYTRGILIAADDVEIDNCELSGFSQAALYLTAKEDGTSIRGIQVHHCYIHHNQAKGLGYGVSHAAAYSTVYNNFFNYNRHSIAATGTPESGYTAYNNVEMGESLGDYFDMHGGRDRGDGTDIAGEYCYIYNNTYLGTNNPYNLRGKATKDREFNFNIVYNPRAVYGTYLTHNKYGNGELLTNVKLGKNLWGISVGKGKVENW